MDKRGHSTIPVLPKEYKDEYTERLRAAAKLAEENAKEVASTAGYYNFDL